MTRRLGLLAALAPPAFTVSAVAATLVTPGYSSVSDTFSLLAGPGSPHPWVVQIGFAAYGLLVQGLGPGLHALAGGGWPGRALWGLVVVYGSGGFLAAVFRDAYETQVLWGVSENLVHDVVARIGFAAILTLSLLTPWLLRRDPRLRLWRAFSYAMAIGSIAFVVPFQIEVWVGIEGVLQRGFFATTMAWVFVAALLLSRPAARS